MRTSPLLEVQEIKTFHNLLGSSYNLELHDYEAARLLGMEIRAARDVRIITQEMSDAIFNVMCQRQREIEEWQKGNRDDVDF